MIVVSDASPLITLAAVGRLEVLRALYGTVCVPEQVYAEVTGRGPGAQEIRQAEWIEVRAISDRGMLHTVRGVLDPGELEAIALAMELRADLILIDESRARAAAISAGLHVVGVLGVIALAKGRGLIPSARELVDAMKLATGFRIAPALVQSLLEAVGEA
ncbi:MAG TPA: DUF3368 domain-containing protein [Longimicrobiaceae bacterium]|nr:DUF3368 domain-containing protein [Longimicrobiaceae bacterium]